MNALKDTRQVSSFIIPSWEAIPFTSPVLPIQKHTPTIQGAIRQDMAYHFLYFPCNENSNTELVKYTKQEVISMLN
jgi:hypothetical protein